MKIESRGFGGAVNHYGNSFLRREKLFSSYLNNVSIKYQLHCDTCFDCITCRSAA
jgi:hypothetical protein